MAIFKGAGVAIVTPFHEDGSINYEKFAELVEFQIAGGTDESVPDGVAKAGHIIETAREKGRQGHETDG